MNDTGKGSTGGAGRLLACWVGFAGVTLGVTLGVVSSESAAGFGGLRGLGRLSGLVGRRQLLVARLCLAAFNRKCRGQADFADRSTNIRTVYSVCEKLISHFSSPDTARGRDADAGNGGTQAFQKALDDTQKQQLPSTTPTPPHQAPTRQHHTGH